MTYAIIDSESLNNPTILNDFNQIKVTIQYEPNSSANKYHHNFLLKIDDDSHHRIIDKIQKEMKKGWYLFFWNENKLTVVFDKKSFEMDLPINKQSLEYRAAQEHGRIQDIQEEYIDYVRYFTPLYELAQFEVK